MTAPDGSNSNHIRAYVLIDAEPDMAPGVVGNLQTRKDIRLVDTINGPFSAIAVVEGQNASEVVAEILVSIRRLKGVRDVVVYLATTGNEAPMPCQAGDTDSTPRSAMV